MSEYVCTGCLAGIHEECNTPTQFPNDLAYYVCCCWLNKPLQYDSVVPTPFQRELKDAEDLKDQTSTGRKRAIIAIESWGRGHDGTVCEWAHLANAGGGKIPVVGCEGNILRLVKKGTDLPDGEVPRNIHHGPDKSTLNNTESNLHAICPDCHNRWHAVNDPHYGEDRPDAGRPHLPSDGVCLSHDAETTATPEQLHFNKVYWSLSPHVRKHTPYLVPGRQ